MHLCIHPSIYPFIHHPDTHLPNHLCIHLSTHPSSMHSSNHPFTSPYEFILSSSNCPAGQTCVYPSLVVHHRHVLWRNMMCCRDPLEMKDLLQILRVLTTRPGPLGLSQLQGAPLAKVMPFTSVPVTDSCRHLQGLVTLPNQG